jgi:hypothetical protein
MQQGPDPLDRASFPCSAAAQQGVLVGECWKGELKEKEEKDQMGKDTNLSSST